jgi:hypothetical protein
LNVVYSAGDLGLQIDFGPDEHGAVPQLKHIDGWKDHLVDGEPVVNPFDVESLPPEYYRLVESPIPTA